MPAQANEQLTAASSSTSTPPKLNDQATEDVLAKFVKLGQEAAQEAEAEGEGEDEDEEEEDAEGRGTEATNGEGAIDGAGGEGGKKKKKKKKKGKAAKAVSRLK